MIVSARKVAQRLPVLFSGGVFLIPADRWCVNTQSGCWNWRGSLNSNGYGKFKCGGKMIYAHRAAYERAKGPIPEGATIDHTCRNRRCCNPAHLEAVSLKENVRRSPRAHKSHCSAGHELSGDNLYVDPKGYRKCRTCKRGYRNRRLHGEWFERRPEIEAEIERLNTIPASGVERV